MDYSQIGSNVAQGLSHEQLVSKISECQEVVNNLENSKIWKIVIRDAKAWCSTLDREWANISDEKKLKEARILKLAYQHILDLKLKYVHDLETAQEQLEYLDRPDKQVAKDFDTESPMEEEDA